jgi:peptidoglycan/LPS O-acetylase OafA/YrhL
MTNKQTKENNVNEIKSIYPPESQQQLQHQTLAYRPELDGLRAIAVLSVIFYHAGFSPFAGGFIGVDVFFVLSGYLMTSIILKEALSNTFALLKFYERRVRRILPMLMFTLLVSYYPAYAFMTHL